MNVAVSIRLMFSRITGKGEVNVCRASSTHGAHRPAFSWAVMIALVMKDINRASLLASGKRITDRDARQEVFGGGRNPRAYANC